MTDQDLVSLKAASQPSSLFGFGTDPGANGLDFGMSQPKARGRYGLLGDVHSHLNGQTCADCPPSAPCPNCVDDTDVDPKGQIIKVQMAMPMPMPGAAPPPIGLLPRVPNNLEIGPPDAWWNWTPWDIQNWLNGTSQSKATKEVEEMCEEQYAKDTINCNLKKAYAGTRAAQTCHEQAAGAYADCLKKGKKSDIPRYDRS